MMNWRKIAETTLSIGVAIAASIIGDKFVAKAAKTIVSKDDENADPIEEEVIEIETVEEKTEEETVEEDD